MNAEVDACGHGFDGWEEGSPAAIATARAARRWRLLLQIEASVEGRLVLEQDCGMLYFLIPEDALAAHDWTAVRCVLQCTEDARRAALASEAATATCSCGGAAGPLFGVFQFPPE